jgi:hypothetical protein
MVMNIMHWVRRRLLGQQFSNDQSFVFRENARFWSSQCKQAVCEGRSYVLANATEISPIVYLSLASLTSIVGIAKNVRPLFVVKSTRKRVKQALLRSYPGADFIDLSDARFEPLKKKAETDAIEAYQSIHSPAEILNFRCDGITFGDVIHDEILALGYARVDKIDDRLLHVLKQFFFMRAWIKDVFGRYDIKISVFSQLVGIKGAVLSRYCLKNKIQVLSRLGSYQLLLTRYNKMEEIGFYPLRPRPEHYQIMCERKHKGFLKGAEEYLNRRMKQQVLHPVAQQVFNRERKYYTDRTTFCDEHGLDSSKPIVFVMLHAFNDFPHSHFFEKRIMFQDYCDWFLRTLEIAKTTDHLNWVFKEHPANRHYITKDLDLTEVFKKVTLNHIRFFPHDADFNARSVTHLAQAVLTCIGPAGLEYATFGIPCVLGGGSGYHGFGFTLEPKNLNEYESCLKNIGSLERLNDKQIETAKLLAFFYFCVMDGSEFSFCPRFSAHDIWKWEPEDDRRFWDKLAGIYRNPHTIARMKEQIEDLSEFIRDESRMQYIDLKRFPLFAKENMAVSS